MIFPMPASVEAVDTAELCAELEYILSYHFGTHRRVTSLERRPSDYRSSFVLEELEVQLADGTILPLMFKDLSQQALLEGARRIRPDVLYNPRRELEVYRSLLMPNRLGTAICYGTVVDHTIGRYWLFIEKVPGQELYKVGEFATWQHVARWLAIMHARFVGENAKLAQTAQLLDYNSDFYWLWIRRAQAFLDQNGQSRSVRNSIEWLARRYDRVVERLMTLPVTIIHGEFYASNVLVQPSAADIRVCPVDWEMAAVGPGLIDLAALVAGNWTHEQKMALAQAYYSSLIPTDGWAMTLETFITSLECCRLHLAVQWLGWFGRRRPLAQHAQDWLGEALCLAEQLDL